MLLLASAAVHLKMLHLLLLLVLMDGFLYMIFVRGLLQVYVHLSLLGVYMHIYAKHFPLIG